MMKAAWGAMVFSFAIAIASEAQNGGEWKAFAPMPSDRQELATAVLNGRIYAIAGLDDSGASTATVDVFNLATNTWSSAHPIPLATNHEAAAVAAGRLYIFGSMGNAAFVYDVAGDSWSPVASSHFPHGGTPAVGVINDKIYVAGGTGVGMQQTELEVYDPVANAWTNLAPMKVPRNHTAGGVIDGKLYVVAGRGSGSAQTALEVYNPQTNSWTTLASMPTARSGVGAAVVHGELYVFGGEVPGGVRPDVEVYNPVSNSWRRVQDMVSPRHGMWASVIGNKVFMPGGAYLSPYGPTGFNDAFVVTSTATFANISTRLKVETGDHALIGGFIVTGNASKRLLIRALGPSIPLAGVLSNPRLEVYDSAGQLIASNDDWGTAPNKQDVTDSSLAPAHNLDAAVLLTVAPGSYTAIVRGEGDQTGIGLVEVYDLEAGSESMLANISTRGFVQKDDDVLIGGLILDGQLSRKVIVRAIGPSLGRTDALADPTLELRNSNGNLVAENDNWRTTEQEVSATTIPPSHDLESAIVRTLPPGAYTAIVRGVNATTGLALVEAYALQ